MTKAQTQAEALLVSDRLNDNLLAFGDDRERTKERACNELRRLHAENEGLQKSYDEAIGLLAQCRDAFSLPAHGTKADDHWIAAISFPEDVPLFVKARIAELEAQAQAVREPLALYQRDAIKAASWRETPGGGYYDADAIINATERAHGITKDKL